MFLDIGIDEKCDGNGVCIIGASCDNQTKLCKCDSGKIPVEIHLIDQPF